MRTTGPSSVMAMVCSLCAALAPGGRADSPSVAVGHVVVGAVRDEHGFDGYDQAGSEPVAMAGPAFVGTKGSSCIARPTPCPP